jgi:DNA helicase II / ATP-dependent DNA helicase PcrA
MGPGRYLGSRRPGLDHSSSQPAPTALRFRIGDEVQHGVFGRGIVIDSKPDGDDEQVTVAFAGIGLKRLLASLAPLEKIRNGP